MENKELTREIKGITFLDLLKEARRLGRLEGQVDLMKELLGIKKENFAQRR